MGEEGQMSLANAEIPATSAPPFRIHFPSMSMSPLKEMAPKTPKSPLATRLMTPMASPMKKAIASMHCYMEEGGHFTRLDPQEAWLPITESRSGNSWYSAFHTLSSGIGVQALVLPLAFAALGWTWGLVCLSLVFIWQLYTMWLLIQLHETESGMRYSRYLGLSMAAFGEKTGKMLALFPIMYLSGGTCVTLIMIGGGTMKIFFQTVCGDELRYLKQPTTTECYVLFICSAIVVAQLPNLNSIAGVSLIGAITAIGYCTLLWIVSVAQGRPLGVSYDLPEAKSDVASLCSILNAIGIIAFAFRGHNLVLEIQGTMPSNSKQPSRLPMWKGVKFAYPIIAMCLFPLAIGGYWAYGNLMMQGNEGMLNSLYKYHRHDTSKVLLGLTSLLVVIHSISSFQIYAMPVFDNLEIRYTSKMNKPCPRWLRSGFRVFFGCLAFFIAVALPFLPSLAGLIGGVALPVTLAYPCLMWIIMKKPPKYGVSWCLNSIMGLLGILLSVLVVFGAIWNIVTIGVEIHFFKPQ